MQYIGLSSPESGRRCDLLLLLLSCIMLLLLIVLKYRHHFSSRIFTGSFLLSSFLLQGCGPSSQLGSQVSVPMQTTIDTELDPFLESYIADAESTGVPVLQEHLDELKMLVWRDEIQGDADESGVVLGRCQRFNENAEDPRQRFRVVEIARPDRKQMVGGVRIDSLTLKTIVYHELGHCLHDFRGHRPVGDGSIMSVELPANRFDHFDQLAHSHFQLMRKQKGSW